jgi:hypothetical protein
LIPLRRSRPNRRQCLTLWQKRTSRKRSKSGDDGFDVYMLEETTSRMMVADRPCGEFYDFYGVSPGYFVYTLVYSGCGFHTVSIYWLRRLLLRRQRFPFSLLNHCVTG